MAIEIERKFLVKEEFKHLAKSKSRIRQGYLASVPERTVRIRIRDKKAFLTIKGEANSHGIGRYEWEKEIPFEEGLQLLDLCEKGVIDKTRYIVLEGRGLYFEVDEFHGASNGLIVAEIELPHEDFKFDKPSWLGKEVTGDAKYYNSALSKKPYGRWGENYD